MPRENPKSPPKWLSKGLSPTGYLGSTTNAHELSNFNWEQYQPPADWLTELAEFFSNHLPMDFQKEIKQRIKSDDIHQFLSKQLKRHIEPSNPTDTTRNVKKLMCIIYAIMTKKVSPKAAGLNFNPDDTDALSLTIASITEGIENCAGGIHERLQSIYERWALKPSLDGFLLAYRTEIVSNFARSRFEADKVGPGMETHRQNFYLTQANQIGFPVLGAVEEKHYTASYVIKQLISAEIRAKYTPIRIIRFIEERIQEETNLKPGTTVRLDESEETQNKLKILFGFFGKTTPPKDELKKYLQNKAGSTTEKEINWKQIRLLTLQTLCNQNVIIPTREIEIGYHLFPNLDTDLLNYWIDNFTTDSDLRHAFYHFQKQGADALLTHLILPNMQQAPETNKLIEAVGSNVYIAACLETLKNAKKNDYTPHLACLANLDDQETILKAGVLIELKLALQENTSESNFSKIKKLQSALKKINSKKTQSTIALQIIQADWFKTFCNDDTRILPTLLKHIPSEDHEQVIKDHYNDTSTLHGLTANNQLPDLIIFYHILSCFGNSSDQTTYWHLRFSGKTYEQIINQLTSEFKKTLFFQGKNPETELCHFFSCIPEKYKLDLLSNLNKENILAQLIQTNQNLAILINNLQAETLASLLKKTEISMISQEIKSLPTHAKKPEDWNSIERKIQTKKRAVNAHHTKIQSKAPELIIFDKDGYVNIDLNSDDLKEKTAIRIHENTGRLLYYHKEQQKWITFSEHVQATEHPPASNKVLNPEECKTWINYINEKIKPKLTPDSKEKLADIFPSYTISFFSAQNEILASYSELCTTEAARNITDYFNLYNSIDNIFTNNTSIWDTLKTPEARTQYLQNVKKNYPEIIQPIKDYLFKDLKTLKKYLIEKTTLENNDEHLYKAIDMLGGLVNCLPDLNKITGKDQTIYLTNLADVLRILPKKANEIIDSIGGMETLLTQTLSAAKQAPTQLANILDSLPDDDTKNNFLNTKTKRGLTGLAETIDLLIGDEHAKLPLENIFTVLPEKNQIELIEKLAFCHTTQTKPNGDKFIVNKQVIDIFTQPDLFLKYLQESAQSVKSSMIQANNSDIALELLAAMTTEQRLALFSLISSDDRQTLATRIINKKNDLFSNGIFKDTKDKETFLTWITLLPRNLLVSNINHISNAVITGIISYDEMIDACKQNNSPEINHTDFLASCNTLDELNIGLTLAKLPDEKINALFENENNRETLKELLKNSSKTENPYLLLAKFASASQFATIIEQRDADNPDILITILSALKNETEREIFLKAKNIGLGNEPDASIFLKEIARRNPQVFIAILPLISNNIASQFMGTAIDIIKTMIKKSNRLSSDEIAITLKKIGDENIKTFIENIGGLEILLKSNMSLDDLSKILSVLSHKDYNPTDHIPNTVKRLLNNNKKTFFELFSSTPLLHYPLISRSLNQLDTYLASPDDLTGLFSTIANPRKETTLFITPIISERIIQLLMDANADQLTKILDAFCTQDTAEKIKLLAHCTNLNSKFDSLDKFMGILTSLSKQNQKTLLQEYIKEKLVDKKINAIDMAHYLECTCKTAEKKNHFIQLIEFKTLTSMIQTANDLNALLKSFPEDLSYNIKFPSLEMINSQDDPSQFEDNTFYLYKDEYGSLSCIMKSPDGSINDININISEETPDEINEAFLDEHGHENIFNAVFTQALPYGFVQPTFKKALITNLGFEKISTLINNEPKVFQSIYPHFPEEQKILLSQQHPDFSTIPITNETQQDASMDSFDLIEENDISSDSFVMVDFEDAQPQRKNATSKNNETDAKFKRIATQANHSIIEHKARTLLLFLPHSPMKFISIVQSAQNNDELKNILANALKKQTSTKNTGLHLITNEAPTQLAPIIALAREDAQIGDSFAKAIGAENNKHWTGFHMIARYGSSQLGAVIKLAQNNPIFIKNLAKAIKTQNDESETGLQMTAQYAPEQISQIIAIAKTDSNEGRTFKEDLGIALTLKNNKGESGLDIIKRVTPEQTPNLVEIMFEENALDQLDIIINMANEDNELGKTLKKAISQAIEKRYSDKNTGLHKIATQAPDQMERIIELANQDSEITSALANTIQTQNNLGETGLHILAKKNKLQGVIQLADQKPAIKESLAQAIKMHAVNGNTGLYMIATYNTEQLQALFHLTKNDDTESELLKNSIYLATLKMPPTHFKDVLIAIRKYASDDLNTIITPLVQNPNNKTSEIIFLAKANTPTGRAIKNTIIKIVQSDITYLALHEQIEKLQELKKNYNGNHQEKLAQLIDSLYIDGIQYTQAEKQTQLFITQTKKTAKEYAGFLWTGKLSTELTKITSPLIQRGIRAENKQAFFQKQPDNRKDDQTKHETTSPKTKKTISQSH